jgi:hypothetical protein
VIQGRPDRLPLFLLLTLLQGRTVCARCFTALTRLRLAHIRANYVPAFAALSAHRYLLLCTYDICFVGLVCFVLNNRSIAAGAVTLPVQSNQTRLRRSPLGIPLYGLLHRFVLFICVRR